MRGLLLLLLLAAGCASAEGAAGADRSLYTGAPDPWYRPDGPGAGAEVPAREVQAGRRAKALALLGEREVVELDEATATALAPNVPAGARRFLVRAVRLRCANGTDGLTARLADGVLVVDWHCMGSRALPMERTAAVVVVQEAPREVRPRVGMTQ